MNVIAQRIRETREQRSYSQSGIAPKGMKQATLSDWERGNIPQALVWIGGIANRLDVSTDYLLGLTDIPRPVSEIVTIHEESDPYITAVDLDDDEYALLQEFRALPDESRRLLIQFLSTLGRGPSIRVIGEDE